MFTPSKYALASSPDGLPGQWGGVALKSFTTRVHGERVAFKVGDHVPAEVTRDWPIPNRMGMQSQRMIRYFETVAEAEQMASVYGREAVASPERAMMAQEAKAERRPRWTPEQIAQQKAAREATLARKKQLREAAAAADAALSDAAAA